MFTAARHNSLLSGAPAIPGGSPPTAPDALRFFLNTKISSLLLHGARALTTLLLHFSVSLTLSKASLSLTTTAVALPCTDPS